MRISTRFGAFAWSVVGAAALALGLLGCAPVKDEGTTGTLNLSLTDAPIDASTVSGVYVTVVGVQYRSPDGGWMTPEGDFTPVTVNLLDLTNGNTALLGDFVLPAVQFTQLRFLLDTESPLPDSPGGPGTYIVDNGTIHDLRVPSEARSGYKATGPFTVPQNGDVRVTADFNVRKAVVMTGMGAYMLRPTIRLVENDGAGTVRGTVGYGDGTYPTLRVLAYEAGAWNPGEAVSPAAGASRFPNAVSSDRVDGGMYHLGLLPAGSYDLMVAGYLADGSFGAVLSPVPAATSVSVTAGAPTTTDLSVADPAAP